MAQFRIKNISTLNVSVFNYIMKPLEKIDLLLLNNTATIIDSLINGELYDLLYGKVIMILHPTADLVSLSLTPSQFQSIARNGFLQGMQESSDIKPAFKFNSDGYLLSANAAIITGVTDAATETTLGLLNDKVATEITLGLLNTKVATETTLGLLNTKAATETTLGLLNTKAATEATLGLLNTKAATEATLAVPSSATTITPNDSTDTTTITAKGLIVGTSGNLSIQSLGTPGVTVAFAVVVGQYVPIKCSKVMAATTAVVIGLS